MLRPTSCLWISHHSQMKQSDLLSDLNRPHLKMSYVLSYDNERPHSSLKTRQTMTLHGCTGLPHLPSSPDLLPSVFRVFGPIKAAQKGKRFPKNDVVKRRQQANGQEHSTRRYTCTHSKVEYHDRKRKRLCWQLDLES